MTFDKLLIHKVEQSNRRQNKYRLISDFKVCKGFPCFRPQLPHIPIYYYLICLIWKTESVGPIFNGFDEDKNSLLKMRNVTDSILFFVQKSTKCFVSLSKWWTLFLEHIFIAFFKWKLVQFRAQPRRPFEQWMGDFEM